MSQGLRLTFDDAWLLGGAVSALYLNIAGLFFSFSSRKRLIGSVLVSCAAALYLLTLGYAERNNLVAEDGTPSTTSVAVFFARSL